MVARFVTRLHRLTLSGAIRWEARDPRSEVAGLAWAPADTVTSSVYYATIDDMRVRLYRKRVETNLAVPGGPEYVEDSFEYVAHVLEFVNADGFADAEYTDLPGLYNLFNVVRRRVSRIDEKIAAFMEKDNAHAERPS